ncbi:MAG TPA: hypothetical protein VJ785_00150, partial [Anaerolineales bacterium]|nr:hypothetical protein [Anaerolineales bacterium]
MRGRKPERFQLKPRETAWLRKLLRAGKTPWRIAGRTQILLPCAEKSQPVGSWSQKLAQSASTSWRIGKPPYRMPLDQVGDAFFPRGQRKDIERLSRREPESVGRPAPHG